MVRKVRVRASIGNEQAASINDIVVRHKRARTGTSKAQEGEPYLQG